MNFEFSEDQALLKNQAETVLRDLATTETLRSFLDAPASHDRALWAKMAELGWLGVAIPEELGGAGLGPLELCVLAEEVGRSLAPVPFGSTLYLTAEAIAACADKAVRAVFLPKIAAGDAIGAAAFSEGAGRREALASASLPAVQWRAGRLSGVKTPVQDLPAADIAVVSAAADGEPALFLVDLGADGVVKERLRTIDDTRPSGRLVLNDAPAIRLTEPGDGAAAIDRLLDRAAVYTAFEQIGAADRCVFAARDYALERRAFGRPIGAFQAIKHRLADMYVTVELARSNAYFGAWALSGDAGALPVAAAAARLSASEAFSFCAAENVHIHGGVGFTWEYDCHLFYRRAKLLALCLGGPLYWRERLMRRLTRDAAQASTAAAAA